MKKRIISFVLSLAILASFLPTVYAGEEAKALTYNFGWSYANDGKTTAGIKVDAIVSKGYTDINKLTYTNSDKWAFAAHNHITSVQCNKTFTNIAMSKDEVENNLAFVALKFSAAEGTYIPTFSHGLYKTSPIVDIYLVKEDVVAGGYTAADLEFKNAASNGDAASAVNKAYIKALGDEYKIASRLDMYMDSKTYVANPAELSSRTLEDGTYYLIIRPVGFSGSETTDTRNMVIYSLTLAPVKEPELESVDLSTENAYVLLDDADGMKLSVSGKMTGGTAADLSSAEITYTTSDEDIATVSDKGVITPVSCGDFIVTVTVKLGDVTLSKSLNLAVSEEPIVPSFEIYFNDVVARETTVSAENKSGYFTKDTHGINWSLNTEQTAANYFAGDSNSARIQGEAKDFLFLSRTGDFAVDFTTAADGYYDITLGVMRNTSCTVINFYVDGKYVGSFDAHSDINETDTVKEALVRSVELKGGKHTLLIRNANSASGNRFIRGVKFTGRAALSEIEKVQIEATRTNLAVGESGDYKVKLMLENGGEYYPPLISSDGAVEEEFAVRSSDESMISLSGGSFKALKPGKAKLTTSGTVDGKNVSGETEITVNELAFEKVDLNLDEDIQYFVGGERKLTAKAILSDGSEVSERDITSVAFESSDENIATVDGGLFKALGEGAVTITAKVTFNNKTVHVSKTVNVESVKLASIEAKTEDNVVFLLDDDGSRILVTGINNDGSTADISGNAFTYESLTPEIVSVDAGGYVHYVSRGIGKVKVSANIGGKAFECEAEVVSGSAKTKPTIYTPEMRETALENVKKYDWAKSLQKSAIARADKWVENLDKLYELMPGEGVPRSYTISTYNAPVNATETTPAMQYNCPWCGVDIRKTTGSYSWGVDSLTRPWKIQCTSCKRLFPSNDFGSFYELGLNKANGTFSRETALARHRELFGDLSIEEPGEFGSEQWKAYYGYGNKEGYLYNELYTEKDSTWMVDDGFGWSPRDGVPGSSESVSTNPKWAPIAFYVHRVWRLTGDDTYQKILDDLREAYLYTGDVKYGRAGAILTDRIADLYPEFDLKKVSLSYANSHGSSYTGKVIGSIWETSLVKSLVKAYDAFYPMMDDPQVISYLSQKAAQFGLENPKTSGELILENAENGIVREVIDAAYTARIRGNFGMHQYSAALAAVALDTYPESGDMFEWLCKPSTYKSASVKDPVYLSTSRTAYTECTGGELLSKYIKDVCRDGFGNEVAAGYNSGWVSNTIEIASLLARYEKDTPISLMKNPKYVKMFDSIIKETVGNGYTLQIGDSGGTASKGIYNTAPETLLAFSLLDKEDKNRIWLAKNYYYSVGGDLDDIYVDIFTDNASLPGEIQDIINEHGELTLESENLTGFGLGVLRDGEVIKASGAAADADYRGDVWMYYGRTNSSHAHQDALQLGLDAYGFNFTPDLGYPEATGADENRYQWVDNTLSHNTVFVGDERQKGITGGNPLHFDSTDRVKLVDAEAPEVYAKTDIYRRTAVSVAASDEVSYTVDFFRIKGGNRHIYSFHTQSHNGFTSEDLTLVPQLDENGRDGMYDSTGVYRKYTYAGVGETYIDKNGVEQPVLYGPDPNGNSTNTNYVTKYRIGYTWLTNVNLAKNVESGNFSVNFKQTDFNKQVSDSKGLNLRFTALNDWTPSEVAITTGYAPRVDSNRNVTGLDYMFIHREGKNLDTLYTSVLEPYKGEEYIESMESVAMTANGAEVDVNSAKAVKVKLKNGRTDYIVYSADNSVIYNVDEKFNFRGFVGVYSVNEKGENIYSYINDGDIIGNITGTAAYTGEVVSFTEELSDENKITIRIDGDVDLESLTNRYIYVNNDGVQNGSYRILSASVNEEDNKYIDLHLGNTSLIRAYKDNTDFDAGYTYNIEAGQSFTVPLSTVEDYAPELEPVSDNLTTSAGSSITVNVKATSPKEEKITYAANVLPRGASLNSETGVVTWKPDASQIGENGFMITARDESGRESSVTFEVTVYGSTTGASSNSTDNSSTDNSSTAGGGGGGGGAGGGTTDSSASENIGTTDKTDNGNVSDQTGDNAPDASGETDTIRFTDLGNHAWAADAINSLAADGIVKGTTETTYSPAANITRADFALLLVRAFNLTSDNTENFADVSASDYFAPELAVARNTGIVNGIGDNKFAPRNSITRQDMMTIVYRALSASLALKGSGAERSVGAVMNDSPVDYQNRDVTEPGERGPSNDGGGIPAEYPDWESVAPYARDAVSYLIANGIVNGKSGLIAPLEYTTRVEIAVLLGRVLDYIK